MSIKRNPHFTDRAIRVISFAQEEATRFNHSYIGLEHLLIGLAKTDGIAARVLNEVDFRLEILVDLLKNRVSLNMPAQAISLELDPNVQEALALAIEGSYVMNHHYIGPEHLLLGLIKQ